MRVRADVVHAQVCGADLGIITIRVSRAAHPRCELDVDALIVTADVKGALVPVVTLGAVEAAVGVGGDESADVPGACGDRAHVADVVRAVGSRATAARVHKLLTLIRDVARCCGAWIAVIFTVGYIVAAVGDRGLVTRAERACRDRADVAVLGALASV